MSGKQKKGGVWLDEDDTICVVKDVSDTTYSVKAGIRGRLIEINEYLQSDPDIITRKVISFV